MIPRFDYVGSKFRLLTSRLHLTYPFVIEPVQFALEVWGE
jgi:hypothetical protein